MVMSSEFFRLIVFFLNRVYRCVLSLWFIDGVGRFSIAVPFLRSSPDRPFPKGRILLIPNESGDIIIEV